MLHNLRRKKGTSRCMSSLRDGTSSGAPVNEVQRRWILEQPQDMVVLHDMRALEERQRDEPAMVDRSGRNRGHSGMWLTYNKRQRRGGGQVAWHPYIGMLPGAKWPIWRGVGARVWVDAAAGANGVCAHGRRRAS
jgi:hypothetical protein